MREFPGVRGVFHCYSGSAEDAKTLVKLGWHLSFTGTITFKNARKAPEVIAAVPLERIMVETDAPYMAPTPFRGKRCDSRYVYRMVETRRKWSRPPRRMARRSSPFHNRRTERSGGFLGRCFSCKGIL